MVGISMGKKGLNVKSFGRTACLSTLPVLDPGSGSHFFADAMNRDRASRSSRSLRIPSSLSRNSEFVGSRSLWAIGFKHLLYNSALVFLFWNCFWADFGRDFCFIDQGF
jgi:hypothetical protein